MPKADTGRASIPEVTCPSARTGTLRVQMYDRPWGLTTSTGSPTGLRASSRRAAPERTRTVLSDTLTRPGRSNRVSVSSTPERRSQTAQKDCCSPATRAAPAHNMASAPKTPT